MSSPFEDQVLALEADRRQAMLASDLQALDRLLNAKLTWTHGSSKVDTKASFIDGFRQGLLRCYGLEFSDRAVQVFGDAAVVTGRVDMDVEVAGERRATANRFTSAWSFENGAPTQILWHSCRTGA